VNIYFSAGEPSGDLHAASLIRQLRRLQPDVTCAGFGGPRMREAGCELLHDMTALSVMLLGRAIANVHRFWRLYRRADEYFRTERPDAVVLIDFPGFNWWVARAARRHNIPVFYYGVPQLWAWGAWRVGKMRRLVDHALCQLPFEAEWYTNRGCRATYVGHPYFDHLRTHDLDAEFVEKLQDDGAPLVTILPGSRMQEVTNNLPWFLKAAEIVRREVSTSRFAVASFNEPQAELARKLVAESGLAARGIAIDVHVGRTAELIHASRCCLACSGSVSLELLYHTRPAAILYYTSPLMRFLVLHFLITVKYITLVNLLANENPFTDHPVPFDPNAPGAENVPYPEYPTCRDESVRLARHAILWLTDEQAYQRKTAQLAALRDSLAVSGASQTAALYIQRELSVMTDTDLDLPAAA
jgi:lipid-A-disaccharide synthase